MLRSTNYNYNKNNNTIASSNCKDLRQYFQNTRNNFTKTKKLDVSFFKPNQPNINVSLIQNKLLLKHKPTNAIYTPCRHYTSNSTTNSKLEENQTQIEDAFQQRPSTADAEEIAKFSALSSDWWNPEGTMKPLHMMNPIRMSFIRDNILEAYPNLNKNSLHPLKDMKVLDMACGAGLSAESLARLGAYVTAVDASEQNIQVAKTHAQQDPDIASRIEYQCDTAENVADEWIERFDAIVALEVVEHVSDLRLFLASLSQMLKPGGALIISTINRTWTSYLTTIIGAEYLLQWLPKGTHDWEKFLTPDEVSNMLVETGVRTRRVSGMVLDPFKRGFKLSDTDTSSNYILAACKDPL